MLDLGIQKGNSNFGDEDYETTYLSELDVNDKITGDVYVSELKTQEFRGNEIQQFYLIITDHKNKKKWVCGINTTVYTNDDIVTIYGAKGGRVYELIDSLNHALNDTELGHLESYSVVFDTFRQTINERVESLTVKATKASNPNAKTPNIQIIKAVAFEDEK